VGGVRGVGGVGGVGCVGVWGVCGCGRCGGVGSLLTFDIPQTALVATLDTYDFIIIIKGGNVKMNQNTHHVITRTKRNALLKH
jgi:hypothetical protein